MTARWWSTALAAAVVIWLALALVCAGLLAGEIVRRVEDLRGRVPVPPAVIQVAVAPGSWPEVRTFRVSAYSLDDAGMRPVGHPLRGVTASGLRVQEGITVACGPSYPLGTVFVLEHLGPRVCTDRGAAIDDGDLDIYMADRRRALAWGVRRLAAIVIPPAAPAREIAAGP